MSGIIAICGPNAEKETDLARTMLSRMKHRGPAFENTFAEKGVILGYVGTGKTDIPLCDQAGGRAVTCDAEVYNADELLPGDGAAESIGLKSANAIINLYREKGESFLTDLNGPFSFVLSDKGEVFAARDPLGILPLYMAERDGLVVFASELKALNGMASNVREFPPGQFYRSRSGLQKYFTLEAPASFSESADSLCEKIREQVGTAVRERVNCCDTKKGVFLSGGIDSSVISALVSQNVPGVDSFTVGMEHSEDVPHARAVAEHLGTNHHEYIYKLDEVLDVLPKVVYHLESFDAPLVRSSTANYIASREAKKHVDTILIGEGGDENFGGYHHVKRFKDPADQQREFLALLGALHNMGFMRTDRMNWAHSLNVRAPFFDSNVVRLALTIHPKLKIYGEEQMEKWILRKAFESYLPKEVVWRPKKQFARGSGSDDLLTRYAENEVSDSEFEAERGKYPGIDFRWKEELVYFRLFKEHYGDDASTLSTVGQWHE